MPEDVLARVQAYLDGVESGEPFDNPFEELDLQGLRKQHTRSGLMKALGAIWWLHMSHGRRVLSPELESEVLRVLTKLFKQVLFKRSGVGSFDFKADTDLTPEKKKSKAFRSRGEKDVYVSIHGRGVMKISDVEGKLDEILGSPEMMAKYDPFRDNAGFQYFVYFKLWNLQASEDRNENRLNVVSYDDSLSSGQDTTLLFSNLPSTSWSQSVEYQSYARELIELMVDVILSLNLQERLSFLLCFGFGFSPRYSGDNFYQHTAAILETSEQAVKTAVYRATKEIQEAIQEQYGIDYIKRVADYIKDFFATRLYIFSEDNAMKNLTDEEYTFYERLRTFPSSTEMMEEFGMETKGELREFIDQVGVKLLNSFLEVI